MDFLLGEGLGHVGVKPDPLGAVALVIIHRGEIRDADDERALVLDIAHVGIVLAAAAREREDDEQQREQ